MKKQQFNVIPIDSSKYFVSSENGIMMHFFDTKAEAQEYSDNQNKWDNDRPKMEYGYILGYHDYSVHEFNLDNFKKYVSKVDALKKVDEKMHTPISGPETYKINKRSFTNYKNAIKYWLGLDNKPEIKISVKL